MKTKRFLSLTAIIGLVMALTAVWGYLISLLTVQEQLATERTSPDLQQFTGLSEDEAVARQSVVARQDQAVAKRKVRREIWRTSTFSIFNFNNPSCI